MYRSRCIISFKNIIFVFIFLLRILLKDGTLLTNTIIMKLKQLFPLLLVLCVLGCKPTPRSVIFTVASYNLRNANRSDSAGGNGWGQRYPWIAGMVRFHEFDIFGTQEGVSHQLKDLKNVLPGYDYTGVGRDDGKLAGEHSAIFYRVDLFELLDKGDFWLSQTPDVPSVGWDAVLPRICSWGHFRHRPTGFEFLFFNLHMDHVGKRARVESAYLVQRKIQELGKGLPAILTGDFNVDQTHSSYNVFVSEGVLRDAYQVCDLRYAPNGTFNSFEAENFTESRIDHIFLSPVFHVRKYGVLTDTYRSEDICTVEAEKRDAPREISLKRYRARVPSDHFPVMVQVTVDD